jgi:hypothetical protein
VEEGRKTEFADKLIHASIANCYYLMNQAACILLSKQFSENSQSPTFNPKNLRLVHPFVTPRKIHNIKTGHHI